MENGLLEPSSERCITLYLGPWASRPGGPLGQMAIGHSCLLAMGVGPRGDRTRSLCTIWEAREGGKAINSSLPEFAKIGTDDYILIIQSFEQLPRGTQGLCFICMVPYPVLMHPHFPITLGDTKSQKTKDEFKAGVGGEPVPCTSQGLISLLALKTSNAFIHTHQETCHEHLP